MALLLQGRRSKDPGREGWYMPQTMSQEITAKLTRRIVENAYPVGAKLPTERELALEFGVTRQVIREALKRLEAVGLVRIRQGSGVHVQTLQLSGGVEMFEVLLTHDDGSINLRVLTEVLEFRMHMVRMIMRLAAVRRTDEEMRQLRTLNEERRASMNNPQHMEEINQQLFRLFARATHNKIYELVFNTVGHIFFKLRSMIDLPLMGHESAQRLTDRLLEAFEERDAEMADLLVLRFMESIQENVEENLV